MRWICVATMLMPIVASAQAKPMPMAMGHGHLAEGDSLSRAARDQIAEARRAASQLDTPEKARAAGYRPRFGDVPLQGVHWSNPALVLSGTFDIDRPPTLMFAPINGRDQLIGVAYTYEIKDGAPIPDGFDGAAMWHEHPALSIPGHRLVMTHVWFIDSPYGPFAHDNPDVPFFERGMRPPPDGWLDAETLRRVALALALAARQAPRNGRIARGPHSDSVIAVLASQRDSVDVQAGRLEQLRRAGDRPGYQALAARIGAESDGLVATIKAIPADPLIRSIFARLLDEALSEHPAAGH